MNSRAARAERRRAAGREHELVAQAHDALHHGDVDNAHELIHGALGLDDTELRIKPLAPFSQFDEAFRKLCLTHGVAAAYVRATDDGDERGTRLLTGGVASLCEMLVGLMNQPRRTPGIVR